MPSRTSGSVSLGRSLTDARAGWWFEVSVSVSEVAIGVVLRQTVLGMALLVGNQARNFQLRVRLRAEGGLVHWAADNTLAQMIVSWRPLVISLQTISRT
jgi:hypothetical protein